MRAICLAGVLVVSASASAAPPVVTPTGEVEPVGVCVKYMDFRRAAGGSVPDGLAERVLKTTYTNGRAVAERWWGFDTPVRHVSHRYDARGRKTVTTWRLSNRRLVLTSRYRYDPRGNLLSKTTSYAANKERWRDDYRYDRRGQLIRIRKSVNAKTGKVHAPTHRFTYKRGRINTERIDRNNDGKTDETLLYHYDARGRLTGKLMQPASKKYAEQLTELSYNGRGQVVERKVSHVWPKRPQWSGPRKIERYQYDAAGNLIIVERRVTPRTAVMNRTVFDYSCQPGSSKPRSLPATGCMASYPKCGKP